MNIAVIFAGGVGMRLNGGTVPKQFLTLEGKSVIVRTLEHFEAHPNIDAIAVAILPAGRALFEKMVEEYGLHKVRWIVEGGETGMASRHAALQAAAADPEVSPDSIVLIHDGVRPLIDESLISDALVTVMQFGSCVTCTKITETVVNVASGKIENVIPRDPLFSAQAPQGFYLREVLQAYDRALSQGLTDVVDTATLMSDQGHMLHTIVGPRSNIKITTREDLIMAASLLGIAATPITEGE